MRTALSAGTEGRGDRREAALDAARSWLGTPYRHQGSRKQVGCDCLGLVRGVFRELYGMEPEDPGAYGRSWALRGGPDRLMAAAGRHLAPVEISEAAPGDVVLFRWRSHAPATHCAILDEGGRLIHAYEGAAVVSSPMPNAWRRRIAAAFRFPE